MKKIVVIYHSNCSDGFGGAWAAYKKLGDKATYIGAVHQKPPPKGLKNKLVYFIDFVYPEAITKKIIKDNKAVVVLDHHVSAENAVKLADDYVYDIKHSGAVIAWKYFHPNKPIPRLLKHIEDQDLWSFKLPYTKEISTAIKFAEFNFKVWNKFVKDIDNPKIRKKYIERGRLLLDYRNDQIRELSIKAYQVKFEGYKILAANAPYFFASQLGNILAEKQPPFSIIWSQMGDEIKVSLRSGKKVDVSKIAAKYGGGGHPKAAGFSIPANEKYPWKLIK